MSAVIKGSEDLQKIVLDQGLCTACGVCTNLCPYIDMVKGKAVIVEPCGLKEGKCYDFCPRTYIDLSSLDKKIFGSFRKDLAIGSNVSVVKARTMDEEIRSIAQYGGVVSAFMAYALEGGELDAAVLTKSYDRINPKPTIVRNREEVLGCAGSKYIVCPTVSEVVEAIKQGIGKIGFVGTPCQVTAVRKMQTSNFEIGADRIGLVIGMFCTWALSPDSHEYIKNFVGPSNVVKLDVPPPPANVFVIRTEAKRVEVPLDDIRGFIIPSCNLCFDMTSEFADISVGAVEGEEGWNTVIVRTELGKKFFQRAKDTGIIETAPLEKEKFDHLRDASLSRKRRVLREIESKKISYLTIREEDKSKLIS